MIGGSDVILRVRDDIPPEDVILRTVRNHWPQFVLQNAEEDHVRPRDPNGLLPVPAGPEFFVYRDQIAADDWERNGARPENANLMLHILAFDKMATEVGFTSVTIVCDRVEGDVRTIIEEIRSNFERLTSALWTTRGAA
jgi:hypothetical protein